MHAIPEKPLHVLEETSDFSAENVHGAYAKTKALATKAVLEFSRYGLDARRRSPVGNPRTLRLLGKSSRTARFRLRFGKLPACVGAVTTSWTSETSRQDSGRGGKGKNGNVLSSPTVTTKSVKFSILSNRFPAAENSPSFRLAGEVGTAFRQARRKAQKRRPLYTKYSLYTLSSNDKFSHEKATKELGYKPRDLYETLTDTVLWLKRKKGLRLAPAVECQIKSPPAASCGGQDFPI
ncbi:MAG: hypothetical protein ACLRSW_13815 [Christensenellaceae bacterium]